MTRLDSSPQSYSGLRLDRGGLTFIALKINPLRPLPLLFGMRADWALSLSLLRADSTTLDEHPETGLPIEFGPRSDLRRSAVREV